MIVLVVEFEVREGTQAQAEEAIRKLHEKTRREPGCREYIGHRSLEEPRRFLLYEVYDGPAALEAHRASQHYAEYVTNGLGKIMVSRKRELYAPVE